MVRSISSRTKLVVSAVFITLLCAVSTAMGDFIIGEPVNLGPTINSSTWDGGPCISPDGLELYVYSSLEGWGIMTLRMATRETPDDPWGEAMGLEPPLKAHAAPSFSADGLSLYSEGPGDGGSDIWMTTRATVSDPWGSPVNLGTAVNSSALEMGASISNDGLELYFGSNRSGGSGDWDMWVSTRTTVSEPWGTATNLGPAINSSAFDGHPCISPDGLILLITSNRPGGYGDWDIWLTRRVTRRADWGPVINLGPSLNTTAGESEPYFSADGRTLYFSDWYVPQSGGIGETDIWRAAIELVVDFNGDGSVDAAEILAMADSWGTDNSLCDIGPMPWGDGVVDVRDLKVLAEYIGEDVVDETLMVHWGLDDTAGMFATDSIGGHKGVAIGAPVWQPDGGQVDGALEFDGVDDHVVTDLALNPADGPFSVLAWIKGGDPGQVIISQVDGVNWLMVDALEGTLATELSPPAGRTPVPPLVSEAIVADDNWHRVAFVWDGLTRSLHMDGTLVAQDEQSSLAECRGSLNIGCGPAHGQDTLFSGLIDDVRIYNRAVRP